jgi:hypothetical protein
LFIRQEFVCHAECSIEVNRATLDAESKHPYLRSHHREQALHVIVLLD